MLRGIIGSIAALLADAFNESVYNGIYPKELKEALVVPIFKTGSPLLPSNYRPISLLSTVGKVFELLIKKRVMKFLMQTEFFSDRQYGFLPGRSTEDALSDHVSQIVEAIENGYRVAGVYIDVRKAFDTVDHEIL